MSMPDKPRENCFLCLLYFNFPLQNASAEGDKWLLNWVGENEDREDVLKEVSSLNKVADLTRENIKKWRASDSAKKEMESLWKVVKCTAFPLGLTFQIYLVINRKLTSLK